MEFTSVRVVLTSLIRITGISHLRNACLSRLALWCFFCPPQGIKAVVAIVASILISEDFIPALDILIHSLYNTTSQSPSGIAQSLHCSYPTVIASYRLHFPFYT